MGEDEADAAQGKISWCLPLARSLAKGRVGDEVVWKRPAGDTEVRIVALERVADINPSSALHYRIPRRLLEKSRLVLLKIRPRFVLDFE